MTTPTGFQRPQHPQLASIFDKAIRRGDEIRYVDEQTLVVFEETKIGFIGGCLGTVILIGLIIISFGLVLLFAIAGVGKRSGSIVTYTVARNGKVKRSVKKHVTLTS